MGLAENIVLSFIKRGLNKALKLDDLPVISSDGLREYRDIPYRNRSDKELLMDIFEPVVAKGTEQSQVTIESSSRSVFNLLNLGANKKNISNLSDFIQNEVWKLVSDAEIKLQK